MILMFLFKDKHKIEIPVTCKLCLKEFKFEFSAEEYKKIEKFPIKREIVHGEKSHKLIVYFNKYLEVENFEIEQTTEKEVSISQEITRQVLNEIGLTNEEVELYYLAAERDVVSIGELTLLVKNKTERECQAIASKFVEKGLFKEILAATPHYSALPPYAALISQLKQFHDFISEIRSTIPPQLKQSFSQLEERSGSVNRLKDDMGFIVELKNKVLSKIATQREDFDKTFNQLEKIKDIGDGISTFEKGVNSIIDTQTQEITSKFETIYIDIAEILKKLMLSLTEEFEKVNKKITEIVNQQTTEFSSQFEDIIKKVAGINTNQVKELTTQVRNIKDTVSGSVQKLQLGALQKSVDKVVENVLNSWLINVPGSLLRPIRKIQDSSDEILTRTKENLNENFSEISKTNVDGIANASININQQLKHIQDISREAVEETIEKLNSQLLAELKSSIEDTMKSINEITASSTNSGGVIRRIFMNISKDFNEAISMAGEKISGISDGVSDSFSSLRNTFSTKIIDTLEGVLDKILKRLEISQITTREFWDKARTASSFTMKDIWFIRSVEAAKSHINSEILKAKAKSLIIAPKITDIDIDTIKSIGSRKNIRIAASINQSLPAVKPLLDELDKMPNVAYRHRELENLWGINKDYEEVVICVISEKTEAGNKKTEIAGIGSIIPEHIKIFVPILEEAWLNARKIK
jgi:hypothetical protein